MSSFVPLQSQQGRGGAFGGADAFLIRPLTDKLAIRFGVSGEHRNIIGSDATIFICHPDDVSFDSMQVSLSHGDLPVSARWFAIIQLFQLKSDMLVPVSGEPFYDEDGNFGRRATLVWSDAGELNKTELDGGYIEKPWGLFVKSDIFTAPGTFDVRLQFTVNLISQAT